MRSVAVMRTCNHRAPTRPCAGRLAASSVALAVLDEGQRVRLPPLAGRGAAVAGAVAEPRRLHPEQGVEPGAAAGDVRLLAEASALGVAPGAPPPLPVAGDVDDE